MANMRKDWTDLAAKYLVGKKIVAVRYLDKTDLKTLGWDSSTVVLQLDDGSIWFPSQDDEGNGPGALFGQLNDTSITLPVL